MAQKRRKSSDIMEQVPTALAVPVRALEGAQGLTLGFRQDHISCEEGGIQSGAGCGNPWIPMNWKGRQAVVHAGELLAAWVETFSPEDAANIRASIPGATGGMSVTAVTEEPAEKAG